MRVCTELTRRGLHDVSSETVTRVVFWTFDSEASTRLGLADGGDIGNPIQGTAVSDDNRVVDIQQGSADVDPTGGRVLHNNTRAVRLTSYRAQRA